MPQELLDRVLESPRLPSLPAIAVEVIDLVQNPNVNIKQIAQTIQNDPALSSRILKTVNSSFYGQSQAVSTVSHALVILGLNSVKTLALGFSLVPNLKESCTEGFDLFTFWKRSLYSAVAARSLSKQAGLIETEEAFLSGLMQDMGMLAMMQTLGEDYHRLLATAGSDHNRLLNLERSRLGIDHAVVGSRLAEKWKLPPLLVEPIRHHASPSEAPQALQPLIRCVALGNRVADIFISENPAEAMQGYFDLAVEWLQLSREQAEPLLNSIHRDTVEMRRLFDLPTGKLESPDQILARANEALLNLSLQSAQQSDQLAQANKALVTQATTDSLTGAANRRHFNEWLANQFAKASPENPLTIMFLDTDHFKKFNDTYGHQLGDKVLVELAALLKKCAPETALVARYGGEEFAVVLPQVDRMAGARLAEVTRTAIESTPVESDEGEKLSITASIGVATHEGDAFNSPEQLVKAADRAVYAAKAAGRNCVRIFTPRPKAAAA